MPGLTPTRGAALAALAAAVATVGAPTTSASAADAPRIHRPSATHLVPAPHGERLVVRVPVTARRAADPTTVRLRAVAKLPDGRRVRAEPSVRAHHGASPRVDHHLRFSVVATRSLRDATGKVTLALTAAEAGAPAEPPTGDAPSTTVVTTLPAPTSPQPDPEPLEAHLRGSDPCGYLGFKGPELCQNVAGEPWSAQTFWASRTWRLDCPDNALHTASGTTLVDTASNRYTETSVSTPGPKADVTFVTIIDDNLTSHPYGYRPVTACVAPQVA